MDYKLTKREQNVLRLFAQGYEPEAIAERLGITTEQVEQASLNVLYKLFNCSLYCTLDTETPAEQRELAGVP